jgi:hypothetical protein
MPMFTFANQVCNPLANTNPQMNTEVVNADQIDINDLCKSEH